MFALKGLAVVSGLVGAAGYVLFAIYMYFAFLYPIGSPNGTTPAEVQGAVAVATVAAALCGAAGAFVCWRWPKTGAALLIAGGIGTPALIILGGYLQCPSCRAESGWGLVFMLMPGVLQVAAAVVAVLFGSTRSSAAAVPK